MSSVSTNTVFFIFPVSIEKNPILGEMIGSEDAFTILGFARHCCTMFKRYYQIRSNYLRSRAEIDRGRLYKDRCSRLRQGFLNRISIFAAFSSVANYFIALIVVGVFHLD